MDLLAYLRASDTIKITKLAFNYELEPPVVASGTQLLYDICPSKPAGTLVMDLDLNQFGFTGLDFHATFTGRDAGTDASGNQLITWEVHQEVNKHIASFDATIKRVDGQFTTVLTAIEPAVKLTSCEGLDRFYAAVLATSGNNNVLTLALRKTILGISQDGELKVTDFGVEGIAGEPLALSVRVFAPQSVCKDPIEEGGTGRAFAIVTGVPFGVSETFSWRVEGGVPIGPVDQFKLTFSTPTANPVQVSVTVKAADQTAFNTTAVLVFPRDTAKLREAVCKLRGIVILNLFIRPLWDPLRNYTARPLDRLEILQIAEFASEVAQLAREIEALSQANGL